MFPVNYCSKNPFEIFRQFLHIPHMFDFHHSDVPDSLMTLLYEFHDVATNIECRNNLLYKILRECIGSSFDMPLFGSGIACGNLCEAYGPDICLLDVSIIGSSVILSMSNGAYLEVDPTAIIASYAFNRYFSLRSIKADEIKWQLMRTPVSHLVGETLPNELLRLFPLNWKSALYDKPIMKASQYEEGLSLILDTNQGYIHEVGFGITSRKFISLIDSSGIDYIPVGNFSFYLSDLGLSGNCNPL